MARTYEEKLRDAKIAAEAKPTDDDDNAAPHYGDQSAELNTNKPKTVRQVMEFLSRCPVDAKVYARTQAKAALEDDDSG